MNRIDIQMQVCRVGLEGWIEVAVNAPFLLLQWMLLFVVTCYKKLLIGFILLNQS